MIFKYSILFSEHLADKSEAHGFDEQEGFYQSFEIY